VTGGFWFEVVLCGRRWELLVRTSVSVFLLSFGYKILGIVSIGFYLIIWCLSALKLDFVILSTLKLDFGDFVVSCEQGKALGKKFLFWGFSIFNLNMIQSFTSVTVLSLMRILRA